MSIVGLVETPCPTVLNEWGRSYQSLVGGYVSFGSLVTGSTTYSRTCMSRAWAAWVNRSGRTWFE